ncbi:HEAT repeat domain-containing protein [bacterium]|nr:HEAT repeat domain-containing protein [bacterium]
MSQDSYETIRTLLASANPEELKQGLKLVKQEISRIGSKKAKELFEVVSAIFYIDPLDRPDLVPMLDEAISLVVGFGDWIIPVLIKKLDEGDIKAELAIGHALGRIGADAIVPLINEYQASTDSTLRIFILYAMGKIKSPMIVQAAPLVIEAAQSQDIELRDTATRSIGKLVESIPPSDLPDEIRILFIERLQVNLADPNPGIRSKAVRSLGKLAKYGHLNVKEKKKLKMLCELILGIDGSFDWDRAYIVRKEAKEALGYI